MTSHFYVPQFCRPRFWQPVASMRQGNAPWCHGFFKVVSNFGIAVRCCEHVFAMYNNVQPGSTWMFPKTSQNSLVTLGVLMQGLVDRLFVTTFLLFFFDDRKKFVEPWFSVCERNLAQKGLPETSLAELRSRVRALSVEQGTKFLEMQNLVVSKCWVQNGRFVRLPVDIFKCHTFFFVAQSFRCLRLFFFWQAQRFAQNFGKIWTSSFAHFVLFHVRGALYIWWNPFENLRIGGATMLSLWECWVDSSGAVLIVWYRYVSLTQPSPHAHRIAPVHLAGCSF